MDKDYHVPGIYGSKTPKRFVGRCESVGPRPALAEQRVAHTASSKQHWIHSDEDMEMDKQATETMKSSTWTPLQVH